jgi:hypothetical protein
LYSPPTKSAIDLTEILIIAATAETIFFSPHKKIFAILSTSSRDGQAISSIPAQLTELACRECPTLKKE